ncbi:MAG: LCP family protein [Clostridia bacterium]|nr:LCP family protein [Clostridia bacterium]
MKTKKKRKNKKSIRRFWQIFGIAVGAIALILIASAVGLYYYTFGEFESQVVEINTEKISLSEDAPKNDLFHVAVFGVDTYESYVGRADSVMIFTVDMQNQQIKLTSILRDSYVAVQGHGHDKINHAYAYGGAELMLNTINSNFDMNISEYLVLDFSDVAMLVDAVGGLDMEITEAERNNINSLVVSMGGSERLTQSGFVHLTGLQVTAYGRIRNIDNEAARSGRQRVVIQRLMDKLLEKNIFEYPKLLREFLPRLETTLSIGELTEAMLDAARCDWNIRECVLPDKADNPDGGIYNGVWYWRYDLDAAATRWHEFLKNKITD